MSIDSIANMFAILWNTRENKVVIPYSRFNLEICRVLEKTSCLKEIKIDKKEQKKWQIEIEINQTSKVKIKRISKPSCRIYYNLSQVRKNCLGREKIWLISTSRGLLTNKEVLEKKAGGEVIGVVSKEARKI